MILIFSVVSGIILNGGLNMGKYDECQSMVRRTPEWTVCSYFSGPWGKTFSYGLDFDEIYKFMCTIPYLGDD